MDIVNELISFIDIPYLIILVCIGHSLKDAVARLIGRFLPKLQQSKMWAVFAIATVIAVPYHFYFQTSLIKLVVTYSVGTSLYDVILVRVLTIIKSAPLKGEASEEVTSPMADIQQGDNTVH